MDKNIERFAAHAHQMWAGWMQYMFKCGHIDGDGRLIIPADKVTRWTRQMNTGYYRLPEDEKESDRKEACEILELANGIHRELSSVREERDMLRAYADDTFAEIGRLREALAEFAGVTGDELDHWLDGFFKERE